jgi:hypothetical protein
MRNGRVEMVRMGAGAGTRHKAQASAQPAKEPRKMEMAGRSTAPGKPGC